MARHETSSGYMAETQCQGSQHKAHDNAFTTRYKGSPRGNRPVEDQEEYEALAKCHGNTIQWNPTP